MYRLFVKFSCCKIPYCSTPIHSHASTRECQQHGGTLAALMLPSGDLAAMSANEHDNVEGSNFFSHIFYRLMRTMRMYIGTSKYNSKQDFQYIIEVNSLRLYVYSF